MMPNMFEFSIALRYLIPNRKQKSLSFVALLASLVIAVVLWLLIVFVSITQSIEHQWLSKMTALSAPLRIKATKAYYDSYYYLVDQHAEASNYALKSMGEKLRAPLSDPFNPDVDENIAHLPLPHRETNGQLIDPIKRLVHILEDFRQNSQLTYEEFVLSAGALHLNLKKEGAPQTLNQILYLTNYTPSSLQKGHLIESWDRDDLNHLLKNQTLQEPLWPLESTLKNIEIQSINIEPFKLKIPEKVLKQKTKLEAFAELNAEGKIKQMVIYNPKASPLAYPPYLKKGWLDVSTHTFNEQNCQGVPLYIGSLEGVVLEGVKQKGPDHCFLFKGTFLDQTQFFELRSQDFQVEKFKVKQPIYTQIQSLFLNSHTEPPYSVLVPKNFKEQGAKVGDKGFISYGAKTLSGFQEMKAPIVVAGFYDPGLFSVGAKVVIGPRTLIDLVGTSATTYALDAGETNGFLLFTPSFKQTQSVKKALEEHLVKADISSYFEVQSYTQYPFVKEILEQFSSDKLIFYLVGFIIFVVALSNVAFLMQLLVRDKSHEMAILRSLGASFKNIEKIFIFSGLFLGLFSALVATILASITLYFIEPILGFLGKILGHNPIHALFYGSSVEAICDKNLIIWIMLVTPLLCSGAAYIATLGFRKKSPSQFLKEPHL